VKRIIWLGALVISLLGTALAVVGLRPQRVWTSDSADAIAEVARGLQAEMKLYHVEAAGHYAKALELDPDFVVPRLLLLGSMMSKDKETVERLLSEVRSADLRRLSARERFLVQYLLAKRDRKPSEASRIIEEHLATHPDDAYALFQRCTDLWVQPDWEAAERCNRELLRVDPNWVLAYNYLGYIAMAQGKFPEAEKNFLAYKFIAPDQANPHDSLGELYTVLGRYEEAEAELDEALRLRPDFCSSYDHLLLVANLRADPAIAETVIARAAAGGQCSESSVKALRCAATLWRSYLAEAWPAALSLVEEGCRDTMGGLPVLTHRAAVLAGRLDTARSLEDKLRKYLQGAVVSPEPGGQELLAGLAHMEAVRTLVEGGAREAVELLEDADRKLAFRGEGQAILKLVNKLTLAEALRAAGLPERADAVRAEVDAVNPRLADLFAGRGPFRLAQERSKARRSS